MQQTKRKDHPRNGTVTYIIIAIKKGNEGHHIVLAMDGNEPFINASGDIVKKYRESDNYSTHLTITMEIPVIISHS